MDMDILTIDIDWAADETIADIASYLVEKKVKATWFVTHDSPAVRALRDHPDLFELGIHPNFFEGSSHGKGYEEVLDYCLNIVPEAVSMRSHGVYQNGRLLSYIAEHTPIKIDSTTFLPEMPGIKPLVQPFPGGSLIRAPFFWADDYEICRTDSFTNIERLFAVSGLRVYMFHPVHIALNTNSWDDYQVKRVDIGNQRKLETHENQTKKGVAALFIDIVGQISHSGGGYMLKSVG